MAKIDDKSQVIDNFLNYKRISVHDENKIKNYRYFVGMFLDSIKKPLKDFEEADLINFLNKIAKKYSIGSMNEIRIMIKCFLVWHYEDYSKRFRNLNQLCKRQNKPRTYSPDQMLSKDDVQKLVQAEEETRWKALLLLFFYGGFRPSEVCQLKHEQIIYDKDGCYIKVYVKKNGKSYEKFIPEDVCFYLKKLDNNGSQYVFPTKKKYWKGDVPMTAKCFYHHLIPLAKKVLGKPVNPYMLRHSIATILYNRDDLKDDDVAQQMGHSKAMKMTYNNLSIEKIRARMKKIYIAPEELPPEIKSEIIKEVKELKRILTPPKNMKNPQLAWVDKKS